MSEKCFVCFQHPMMRSQNVGVQELSAAKIGKAIGNNSSTPAMQESIASGYVASHQPPLLRASMMMMMDSSAPISVLRALSLSTQSSHRFLVKISSAAHSSTQIHCGANHPNSRLKRTWASSCQKPGSLFSQSESAGAAEHTASRIMSTSV